MWWEKVLKYKVCLTTFFHNNHPDKLDRYILTNRTQCFALLPLSLSKQMYRKEDKEKQLNQEKMRKEAEDKSKEDYKNNIERIK